MPNTEPKSEIFGQRLVVAVLWNICLQVCVGVVLIFLIHIDVLHPVSWLTSTFRDIFGIKMTVNIMLLALVSVFQATIYGRYHLVPPPKYFTRFSLFINMFTFQNTVFCLLYALSGYFTMSLYSSLTKHDFYVLKKTCEKYDGQCLQEESLFFQFGGMWMGLYYFISRHIFGTTMLMFPHVHQNKYHQIKLAIKNIIPMGFNNAVTPAVYYCVFYIIWGNKMRGLISDVYSLYLEDAPLDNTLNLLTSGIWMRLSFYMSLYLISVYIMRSVFNIVLTEPMKFPIDSDKRLTLHDALGQTGQFNGFLGAQDLRMLSIIDPNRRSEIFTLSLPGGHPRNWNNILQKCLRIMDDFSKDLESINCDPKSDSSNCPSTNTQSEVPMMYQIRNLAQSPKLFELKDHKRNVQDNNTMSNFLKEEFNQLLAKFCQKPGICYFFGELTDTKLKFLLTQAQPVMWTCEGLAFLAAASLKEDKYGIVQNDLPIIIAALVNLKQNLEKITRLGLVPRKILNDSLAIKMKSALMSSVKRSIYKIIITFSRYMNDIPLPPDIQVAIQPFLLCKEA